MSQTSEHLKTRLNNLSAIEPLLSALRTISMGTWQLAQKKIARMQQYEQNYSQILVEILPEIDVSTLAMPERPRDTKISTDTVVLLLGTERGLCGKFNETLADNTNNWIKAQDFSSHQIWVMGSKMKSTLDKKGISYNWHHPLPASSFMSYQESYLMTQTWLDQFESYQFNRLVLLHNESFRSGKINFSALPLLPYNIQSPSPAPEQPQKRWPPPIIETDPKGIYHQIIQHFIASSFYQALLKSAAAEHSSRFRMMEEAKQNADEIMAELTLIINAERKRQITQETQELAVSAGLMDNK